MLENNELKNFEEKFELKREQPLLQSKIVAIINIYKTSKQRKGEQITENRLEDIQYILELCINIEDEDLLHDQIKSYLINNLYHNYCFLFFRSWSSYFKESLMTTLNWHIERKELNRAKSKIIELEKEIIRTKKNMKNTLQKQKREHNEVISKLNTKIKSLNEIVEKLSQEIEVLQSTGSIEEIQELHKIISELQRQNMTQSNSNQQALMFDEPVNSSQSKKHDTKPVEKQEEYVFLELQPT